MTTKHLVTKENLGTGFKLDTEAKKINIDFTLGGGIKDAALTGSTLQFIMDDGTTTKDIDFSSIVPAAKADVFLKSVTKSDNNLVFTVGSKDSTEDDTTITTSLSDLIPVSVGDGLQGDGTANSKLALKFASESGLTADANGIKIDKASLKASFKPVATIELQDAFGETIGYCFAADERSAS